MYQFCHLSKPKLQDGSFLIDLPQVVIPGALERCEHCASGGICASENSQVGCQLSVRTHTNFLSTTTTSKKTVFNKTFGATNNQSFNSCFCDQHLPSFRVQYLRVIRKVLFWTRGIPSCITDPLQAQKVFYLTEKVRLWCVWCKTWAERKLCPKPTIYHHSELLVSSLSLSLSLSNWRRKKESVIWQKFWLKKNGRSCKQ